ncbi:MAG: hypothetical protein EAZ75_00165 [Flavobacteriia bacterium]|nr:MAG: hypothetical protein EAZ75_00165 [Flavobacteriia bacterium]
MLKDVGHFKIVTKRIDFLIYHKTYLFYLINSFYLKQIPNQNLFKTPFNCISKMNKIKKGNNHL